MTVCKVGRFFVWAWAALLVALPAAAQHVDQLLLLQGGNVVVGTFDFGTSGGSVARVPFGRLLSPSGGFWYQANPGWNAVTSGIPSGYAPLPGNADVSFRFVTPSQFLGNLAWWNGEGAPGFGNVTGGERLLAQRQVAPGQFLTAVADGGYAPVPGFVLGTTGASGSLHRHIDFFLLGPTGGGQPSDGVYLVTIEASVAGVGPAEPAFLVFGKNVSQSTLDAALQWVDVNLVPDCQDRKDNDGDGLVDFASAGGDPGCASAHVSSVENPQCSNGLDDDGDGFVDHPADPQCAAPSGAAEQPTGCGLLGIEWLWVPALAAGVRGLRRRGLGAGPGSVC